MIFFSNLGLVFNFYKKNLSWNVSNFHICYRELSALQNGVGFISGRMLEIGQKNYFIIRGGADDSPIWEKGQLVAINLLLSFLLFLL